MRSVPEQPVEGEDTSVSSCMCMDYATCVYVYVCLPTCPSLSVCPSICTICLWNSQYPSVPQDSLSLLSKQFTQVEGLSPVWIQAGDPSVRKYASGVPSHPPAVAEGGEKQRHPAGSGKGEARRGLMARSLPEHWGKGVGEQGPEH